MRVTDYEVYEVPPRWLLLKIETSNGLIGWGDPTEFHHPEAVIGAVECLMDRFVVGNSPLRVEDIWNQMYRLDHYREGPILMSAIGGIDTALWDIKGQSFGAPIYDLLGGRTRDKIRTYQHIRRHRHSEEENDRPEDLAEDAKNQVDKGFSILKMTPTESFLRLDAPEAVSEAHERFSAIREAVGDEIQIGLDFHGRMSKAVAKQIVTELEEYNPMFYEEPLSPEQVTEFNAVSDSTTVPIAAGERIYSRWGFRRYLEDLSLDIIQPDPSHAGGVTEVKKIMDMGEAYDVEFIPHTPYSPINFAAGMQVIALSKTAVAIEQLLHTQYHGAFDVLQYLEDPTVFGVDDTGFVAIPRGPGLGVNVDEQYVEEKAREGWNFEVHYRRPEDGSIPREAGK